MTIEWALAEARVKNETLPTDKVYIMALLRNGEHVLPVPVYEHTVGTLPVSLGVRNIVEVRHEPEECSWLFTIVGLEEDLKEFLKQLKDKPQ